METKGGSFLGRFTETIGGFFREKKTGKQILEEDNRIIDKLCDKVPQTLNPKDAQIWCKMLRRLGDTEAFVNEQISGLFSSLKKEYSESEKESEKDFFEFAAYTITYAAALFLSRKTIHSIVSFAQRNNLPDIADDLKFCSANRNLSIEIQMDAMSIVDFFDDKKEDAEKSISDRFLFLIEAVTERDYAWIKSTAKKNKNNPVGDCPDLVESAVDDGKQLWLFLASEQNNTLDQSIANVLKQSKLYGLVQEAQVLIPSFFKQTKETRSKIIEILKNPNNPNFASVINITTPFLISPILDSNKIIFAALGLSDKSEIVELYRKAKQYVAANVESQFYRQLATSIETYIFNSDLDEEISTLEDVRGFLGDFKDSSKEPDAEKEMTELINRIFELQGKKDFLIDPSTLQWNGTVPPQEIQVHFDRNRPHKFSVSLSYTSLQQEKLSFVFDYDLKRKMFDWSVLDDPESHEKEKQSIDAITCALLKKILEKEIEEKNRKKNSSSLSSQIQSKPPIVPKQHYHDPIYTLRREKAKKRNYTKKLPQHSEISSEKSEPLIKIHGLYESLLTNITPEDGERIKKAIEQFNHNNFGFLKKLKDVGLYVLKVGKIRILLKEGISEKGQRNFEIESIRYRKDAYRSL